MASKSVSKRPAGSTPTPGEGARSSPVPRSPPDAKRPVPPAVDEFLEGVPGTSTEKQQALRRALGGERGIGGDYSINCRPWLAAKNKTVVVPQDQLRKLYTRRRDHLIGHNLLMDFIGPRKAEFTPKIAWMFWHRVAEKKKKTRKRRHDADSMLPSSATDGIASLMAGKGFDKVNMITFDVDELRPELMEGVNAVSAEEFLPRRILEDRLAAGVPVQLLSDYVRAKAVYAYGGWVVDADAIWLSAPPNMPLGSPPNFGHFSGSALQGLDHGRLFIPRGRGGGASARAHQKQQPYD